MGSPLRRALSLLLVTAALGRELAPRTVSILPTPGHAGHVVRGAALLWLLPR